MLWRPAMPKIDIARVLPPQPAAGGTNNVTKYYRCCPDGPRMWILMDFASGGSVRTLMKAMSGSIVEDRYSVIIVRQLLVVLAYLYNSRVIHSELPTSLSLSRVSVTLACPSSSSRSSPSAPHWLAPVLDGSGDHYVRLALRLQGGRGGSGRHTASDGHRLFATFELGR